MGKGTLRKWLRTFVVAPQATFMFSTPSRAVPVLTALVLGGGALIGATVAMADPAVATTAPFTFNGTNTCVFPAEDFKGTGKLHLLFSSSLSTGGMVQSHTEANLQGLQAVTLSGKKYVVPDSSTHTIVFDTPDLAPFHETLEWTVQFVRVGEDGTSLVGGDDFYEHFLAHATVNANGVVTVEDLTDDTRCQ